MRCNVPNRLLIPFSCAAALLTAHLISGSALAERPSLFATPGTAATQDPAAREPATASQAEPVAAETPAADLVMRIDVRPAEGDDPEEVYQAFFSEHTVHPRVVRAHIRRLMAQENNPRRFAEVIAIINSCLRTGQMQPWMYEALSLAMQLDDRPLEEIERVLMSSVAFSSGVNDRLMLAAYMDRIGLEQRALSLYREVAEQHPTRAEPLVQGLSIARRLNDEEGLKWATLGILRQAWPESRDKLRESAAWTAQSLLERMQREGRAAEARAYLAELREAQKRDVEIRVLWEGDADIDMLVEEPAGTVCSFHQPRTTAGGVMLGTAHSSLTRQKGEGNFEVYVCPEAFSGTYRVLLRQVWGRVAAGQVTLEIRTLDEQGQPLVYRRNYPIGERDTMVVFDIEHGRRQENLEEHQVAVAAQGQLAVNRAVLAQQINALTDQEGANGGVTPIIPGVTPIVRRGAVGYRPELTILPEGANMTATAVISADRRYVRITARPLFSQITNVSTFSIHGVADNSRDPFDFTPQPQDPVNPVP